jgi:cysteine desulfurase / selenocysteine lyase
MPDSPTIYLDNAATSFPKPEAVYEAVDAYNRRMGAAVGRGGYRRAVEVQAVVDSCRRRVAELFNAERPERIVFTFNGTDSLNLALHGLLARGDHVVTSTLEHNSVLRPLRELQTHRGVEVSYLEPGASGRIDPLHVRSALRPNTKLVALIHASNVTGTIQPIADVGEIARAAGALFLVDAAQSAGHVPIDVTQLPLDLLACPGHKGLLGPLGTGLLYLRSGVEERVASLRQGGTGSQSEDDAQPASLPDKYESGNHNAPGLCGLEAALVFLHQQGPAAIHRHEQALTQRFLDGLAAIPSVQTYGDSTAENRVGVVSLTHAEYEPHILATILDETFQIQTRAGLHCAPGVHRHLGTFETGGTVRFSVGPFTTTDDIDAALSALRKLSAV